MSSLSPDLKSGLIFASFHILGHDPEIMLLFTMYTRLGAIMFVDILRILGPMLSNPVDLLTFTLDKNFLTKPVLVNGILNSVSLVIFDCAKLFRRSNSEFMIGFFN